jgi:hypothetical protein
MKTLVQLAAFVVFAAWLQRLEIARANEQAYQAWYVQQGLMYRKAIAKIQARTDEMVLQQLRYQIAAVTGCPPSEFDWAKQQQPAAAPH